MAVEALLFPIFNRLISTIIEGGIEEIKKSAEAKHLRLMVRERLGRELRFNDELLKYDKFKEGERVSVIETEALDFIMSQPMPLGVFFNLSEPLDPSIFINSPNDNHTSWGMTIKSEGELVERWWHRVRLAQLKQKAGLPPGDLAYLHLLCRALHTSLMKID